MRQDGGVRNNLRAVRARLGLSQQELATAAGVTRQTIGGIEGSLYAPSAAVALRLARALGCRVEDVFWLDEDSDTIEAAAAEGVPSGDDVRLSLARVAGRWVAHPLSGETALRTEMIPCDGVGSREAGSDSVRVRLNDDPGVLERTVALAGCTPVLSLWARAAERWNPGLRVYWTFANSMEALHALRRGEVHVAGIHLVDGETGEANGPFVRQVLGSRPVSLVHLGIWEEGLVVQTGNPKGIRAAEDLARPDVLLVNREEGAGSRLHLEQILQQAGIAPSQVRGFEQTVRGHWEVARAVASGEADAGISTAAVATAYGLGFAPLREVRYDLAVPTEFLGEAPVRQLLSTLDHRWIRRQFQLLGGYDTRLSGEVVAHA